MPNLTYIDGRGATKGLWHFENNATDSSLYGLTLNRGDTSYNSVLKKFGTHSLLFGAGGIAYVSDFPLNSLSQWTVDFWLYASDPGGGSIVSLFDSRTADGSQGVLLWYIRNDGAFKIYCMTSTGTYKDTLSIGYTDNWIHIAIVKTSDTQLKLFYNGSLISTLTIAGTMGAPNWTSLGFIKNYTEGAYSLNQSWPSCHDEFRISSTARWTAAFTPPTAAYPY